jgi:hypothetical protein
MYTGVAGHYRRRTFQQHRGSMFPRRALTIISAFGAAATITSVPAKNQIVVSSLSNFDTADKRYISIGGIESRTISTIDTGTKTITLTGNMAFGHPAGTRVFPIRATSYQVVMDGSTPVLKRTVILEGFQPLAENIETVQFNILMRIIIRQQTHQTYGCPVTVVKDRRNDPDYKGGGLRRRQVIPMSDQMGVSP